MGLHAALEMFSPAPVEFTFGVRRTSEGLAEIARANVSVTATFPGRGLSRSGLVPKTCDLSAYQINRLIESGKLAFDALVVVAGPAAADGSRSLGTVNGYMQCAIDRAPLIIVEEDPALPAIPGAARIAADKPIQVMPHVEGAYQALSRSADDVDRACAAYVARLIEDSVTLQLGVGGVLETVGKELRGKQGLRLVTGAIGASARTLHEQGCLAKDSEILGTALVGDSDLVGWARATAEVKLGESRFLHDANWLAELHRFHSINAGISVDLSGNVNSEWASGRRISGKGGAPDFARGAHFSRNGGAIIVLRSDRTGCLVERLERPTIPGAFVSWVVCERGIADLRNKDHSRRAAALERLLA